MMPRNSLELQGIIANGAEGENRTRTTVGHCPLKTRTTYLAFPISLVSYQNDYIRELILPRHY